MTKILIKLWWQKMNLNQLIEQNKALEEHRWDLLKERNKYKRLYNQAVENQRFRNRMYGVVIVMLMVLLFTFMGVVLWAQSFNQVM